jgi:putative ATPase
MPAISTGIFGFPKERAAGIAYSTIETYFSDNPDSTVKTVKIVLFDSSSVDVFITVWQEIWADTP